MNESERLRSFLALALLVTLVAVALLLELPDYTRLWRDLQNSGHALLFGTVAIAALTVTRYLLAGRLVGRLTPYLIAFALTVLMGAGVELVQLFSSRDSDLFDLLIDAVGAASFLGIHAIFDSSLTDIWSKQKRGLKVLTGTICVVMLLTAFTHPILQTVVWYKKSVNFPTLASFGSRWDRNFLHAQQATLDIVGAPKDWPTDHNRGVGKLTFSASEYSGLLVIEPCPNWSKFDYLCFDIFSESDSSLVLTLKIDDRDHNGDYDDRFNEAITVAPGINEYRIPLVQIQSAPEDRDMNLRQIAGIWLFASHPPEGLTIFLDDFHLE